ncbi:MAG: hypothetical protein JWO02_3109 [Solirubrobacterales bacterium]|nr:hypothetical protein [Solirubrobacterales bacterium]
MSSLSLGLALATLAAVAVNAGYVVQHGALSTVEPLHGRSSRETLRALLASRRWVIGALLGYGGLATQIVAMALAPAWAVQAVLAAGLVVALAGWAWRDRAEPMMRQLVAVAMIAAGLVVVVRSVGHGTGAPQIPMLLLGLFAATAVGAALAAQRIGEPAPSPSTDAVAAGLLYGVTTTAIATTLAILPKSVPQAGGVLLFGAACAVAGLPRFQRALQGGAPVRAVLLMSAATNVTAILGGLLLAGGNPPEPLTLAGLLALGGAGVVAAGPASTRALA